MVTSKKTEPRIIYKKDSTLSGGGFTDVSEAMVIAEALRLKYVEPQYRVRVRLRNRTQTWDVVVKIRTEVAA